MLLVVTIAVTITTTITITITITLISIAITIAVTNTITVTVTVTVTATMLCYTTLHYTILYLEVRELIVGHSGVPAREAVGRRKLVVLGEDQS